MYMGQTTGKVFFKLSCQAANGNQTSPETSWDTKKLGVFGYSQKCIEQDQLSTIKHNGYCFVPFNIQMIILSKCLPYRMWHPKIVQAMFHESCSGGQCAPKIHRTAYMKPMHLRLKEQYVRELKAVQSLSFSFQIVQKRTSVFFCVGLQS